MAADYAVEVVAPHGRDKPLCLYYRAAFRARHTCHDGSTKMGFFKDAEPNPLGIPEVLPQVSYRKSHLAGSGEQ